MPRPILKTLSSYASPVRLSDSASIKEGKHVSVRRHAGVSRRVTFSPFTKTQRGDSPTKSQLPLFTDGKDSNGLFASGFTFSSATEAEKKKQSRRKEELQTMQILYRAAMRRPRSIKSLLLANVPGLKRLDTLASEWMGYAKALRNAVQWPRPRSRQKRRLRRLVQGRWTDFDDADHKYVQQLARSSTTTHPTSLLSASNSSRRSGYEPLDIMHRSPRPDLTPASRGGFTSLLREAGIPVDEDECIANRRMGLNHRRRIRW